MECAKVCERRDNADPGEISHNILFSNKVNEHGAMFSPNGIALIGKLYPFRGIGETSEICISGVGSS